MNISHDCKYVSLQGEGGFFFPLIFLSLQTHGINAHTHTHTHTHIAAQKGFMVMIEKIIEDSNTRNDIIQKKWAGLHPQHPGLLTVTTASDVHRSTLVLSRDLGCMWGGPLREILPALILCVYAWLERLSIPRASQELFPLKDCERWERSIRKQLLEFLNTHKASGSCFIISLSSGWGSCL